MQFVMIILALKYDSFVTAMWFPVRILHPNVQLQFLTCKEQLSTPDRGPSCHQMTSYISAGQTTE